MCLIRCNAIDRIVAYSIIFFFFYYFVNDHVAPDNEVIFLVMIICNSSKYFACKR